MAGFGGTGGGREYGLAGHRFAREADGKNSDRLNTVDPILNGRKAPRQLPVHVTGSSIAAVGTGRQTPIDEVREASVCAIALASTLRGRGPILCVIGSKRGVEANRSGHFARPP